MQTYKTIQKPTNTFKIIIKNFKNAKWSNGLNRNRSKEKVARVIKPLHFEKISDRQKLKSLSIIKGKLGKSSIEGEELKIAEFTHDEINLKIKNSCPQSGEEF
ncbi:hypothetical protein COI44_15275 [Bacillus sp. AFS088145]|nr:hypothetical protein COI44_15275 [Bacillus sp. AFS088145]